MMFMEYGIMEEILKLIFILVNIMLYTCLLYTSDAADE